MLSQNERKRIIALINREVVPAIGCTEPIAVALCTARAAELLGSRPEKVAVRLSANILKNAMGVGIPGTGMIGLPIAVALGALVGRSEYRLEVLRDVTPGAVEQGRRYIDEKRVCIDLKQGIAEKLYIEVEARGAGHCATAVIAGGHTSFVYLERDGEVTLDKRTASAAEEDGGEVPLTLHRVWEFATTAPLDELRFILETRRLNKAAAEQAFAGEFGHCVGRTLRCERERKIMGDSIFSRILSYTSAACDARMAGAMIPVMSNSGSGNQGIAATLPVVVYAEQTAATEQQTIRALVLSHLTVIYIKQSLGRLSALCGCVVDQLNALCLGVPIQPFPTETDLTDLQPGLSQSSVPHDGCSSHYICFIIPWEMRGINCKKTCAGAGPAQGSMFCFIRRCGGHRCTGLRTSFPRGARS